MSIYSRCVYLRTTAVLLAFCSIAFTGLLAGQSKAPLPGHDAASRQTNVTAFLEPALTIVPNPVELTAVRNAAPFAVPITIASSGDEVNFGVTVIGASGANTWLSAGQTYAGTGTANNLILNVNPSGLATGVYTGSVTILPANSSTSIVAPVSLTVVAAMQLAVDNASLSFFYQIGTTAPVAQTVNVTSAGGLGLPYSATVSTPNSQVAWLKVDASGTAPGLLPIGVDPTGLAAGTYNGTITLTALNVPNVTASIQVQLKVSNTPVLIAAPSSLHFETQTNINPQPKQLLVSSSMGALTYSVSTQPGTDWLFFVSGNVAGAQGAATVVSPSAVGKPAGIYTSKLILSTPAGAVTPAQTLEVPVTMKITEAAALRVTPAEAIFDIAPGTTAFQRKDLMITSTDSKPAQFTVSVMPESARSWLFSSLNGGTISAASSVPLSIIVSPATLTTSRYDAEILVSAIGGAAPVLHIPVSVHLAGQVTFASAPAGALTFTAEPGSGTQIKTLQLTSDPPNAAFAAQSMNPDWLQVVPSAGNTGSSGANVAIRVDPSALSTGIYSGVVNIVSRSGTSSPFTIPVKLTVGTPPVLTIRPANLTFNYTRGQAVPPQQTISVTSGAIGTTFRIAASTNNGNSTWLIPVVTATVAPASVGVKIDPTGLATGTYTGSVVITGTGTINGPQTAGITLVVADIAAPVITDVQNGASFQSTAAAPGLIVTIRGFNLGPATGVPGQVADGFMSSTLSDTQVYFDRTPAPLLYVSDKQINAIVPYDVFGRSNSTMWIERFGVKSNGIVLAVKDSQPGIFTLDPGGQGQGAILNQDSSMNGPSNPAVPGSTIQIFGTGEGQTAPGGVSGKMIDASALRKPLALPVTVRIGGKNADVTYSGSAPALVSGALQVNAKIPADTGTGNHPVEIQIGSAISQTGVTVAVK